MPERTRCRDRVVMSRHRRSAFLVGGGRPSRGTAAPFTFALVRLAPEQFGVEAPPCASLGQEGLIEIRQECKNQVVQSQRNNHSGVCEHDRTGVGMDTESRVYANTGRHIGRSFI